MLKSRKFEFCIFVFCITLSIVFMFPTRNVKDITFSNINISTRYYDPSWWARAEPVYITTKEGSITDIQFINITPVSENGVFLSGSKGRLIKNLKLSKVDLNYRRWTNYVGGLVDYRPGCFGLINQCMAWIIMEYIDVFEVKNVNMRWSKERSVGWDNPLDFRASTVNNISFLNF